jgi:hypothetical protein
MPIWSILKQGPHSSTLMRCIDYGGASIRDYEVVRSEEPY